MVQGDAAAQLVREVRHGDNCRVNPLYQARRPLKAATIALVLLACLASAAALTWSMYYSRALNLSNAAISTSNTALSLANQASSSFKMADTVLVSLVDKIEVGGWSEENTSHLRGLMVKHMADLPALQGLFVYDENGRWIVNSASRRYDGRNNADREYFQFHRNTPGRGVHIGTPIIGRTSGLWVLPVSRRIEAPDGSFAGVALATIKIDFFRAIYDSLDIGDDGRIMMTLDKGTLLVREPFDTSSIGQDIASQPMFMFQAKHGFATETVTANIDGQAAIYSHARVGTYPVGITVLRDQASVLRPWLHAATFSYAALLLLIAGLLMLGRRVVRQVGLRDRLERELLSTKAELESANCALSTMAYVDGLTELFNRRYYEQALGREYGRACRNGAPISILMMDVDFFKNFNDRYGHASGDEALKAVAQSIQRGLKRSGDLAARYGGEEFIVVLPDTDLAGASDVAETIRAMVMHAAIPHRDSPAGVVTVSIGICTASPRQGSQSAADIVAQADAALYRAKAKGRNCSAT